MKEIIGVCIPTYKREKQLKKLLIALSNQKKNESFEFEVLVVDNDKNRTAKKVIDNLDVDINLHYYIEYQKGVSNVRNKCIEESKRKRYNYIAFIDDDELPNKDWLYNLYKTLHKYDADVVFGPVIATYSNEIPNWIIEGGFFERPRYKTGDKIDYSGSGNVLIDLDIIQNLDVKFDTFFNESGGEDTDFFMIFNKNGANMVWCNEAIVSEPVDINRATPEWLYLRSFCAGSNFVLCEMKNNKSISTIITRLIKGILHCAIGIYQLIISRKSITRRVRAKMKINIGIGQIVGILGKNKAKQY